MIISGLDIGGAHGGAERFGLELTCHLNREFFDVTLCAFWRMGSKAESHWIQRLKADGVKVIFASDWPGNFRLNEYIRGIRHMQSFLVSNSVDIIHSHYQMGSVAAIFLKLTKNVRAIIRTAHVSKEWGKGFPSWISRQVFNNWLYPLMLDAEIGVSQAVVKALKHHPGTILARKSPHLIHNAIYPEAFESFEKNDTHPLLIEYSDFNIIGSVGRLTDQKGYTYLLDAVPLVLEHFPKTLFIIIGDGHRRSKLMAQASRLGIVNHIKFTGQRDDVLSMIRKMDLFVLPSIFEGLPTVILESMACGTPVMATDIPGNNELIHHQVNGWLIPPRNSSALANAIIEALSQPNLRTLFSQKSFEVVNSFRMETVANKYETLYRNLMGHLPLQVD
jgi:glycosyltransferase involved in cell wall biosynthesis